MKAYNQVTPLYQAELLRDLGVLQSSLLSWCGDKNHIPADANPAHKQWVFISHTEPVNCQDMEHRDLVPSSKPFAAAFSVSELLHMLPENVNLVKRAPDHFEVFVTKNNHPHFDYQDGMCFYLKSDESFAEALAGFLIFGIQQNTPGFEVSAINTRISR